MAMQQSEQWRAAMRMVRNGTDHREEALQPALLAGAGDLALAGIADLRIGNAGRGMRLSAPISAARTRPENCTISSPRFSVISFSPFTSMVPLG